MVATSDMQRSFCDPDHDHIITENLRLIKNQKLRNPILQNEKAKQYLKDLQTKSCTVPIHKASNNLFLFVRNSCRKFYVSKLLDR